MKYRKNYFFIESNFNYNFNSFLKGLYNIAKSKAQLLIPIINDLKKSKWNPLPAHEM